MDAYTEQIVSKIPTTNDTIKKVGIGVLAILAALIVFLVTNLFGLSAIGLLLAGGCIYGGFYFITCMDVEYEYIITNGEIDIDKIIAKRKRKRLITAKASTFEKFGLLKEADQSGSFTTVLASCGVSSNEYYADFKHTTHGQVRLIFSPNEKVLEALKPYISRTIR